MTRKAESPGAINPSDAGHSAPTPSSPLAPSGPLPVRPVRTDGHLLAANRRVARSLDAALRPAVAPIRHEDVAAFLAAPVSRTSAHGNGSRRPGSRRWPRPI